jgi:hypothetical protein
VRKAARGRGLTPDQTCSIQRLGRGRSTRGGKLCCSRGRLPYLVHLFAGGLTRAARRLRGALQGVSSLRNQRIAGALLALVPRCRSDGDCGRRALRTDICECGFSAPRREEGEGARADDQPARDAGRETERGLPSTFRHEFEYGLSLPCTQFPRRVMSSLTRRPNAPSRTTHDGCSGTPVIPGLGSGRRTDERNRHTAGRASCRWRKLR